MLWVAEIGLNYEGNFDLAYELIRQAKLAGANIAKFQFGWRCQSGEINHIDENQARRLREWCDSLHIEFLASVITEEGFALARAAGVRRYKIASRTVADNPSLCERVLADGKETFISLGMWTGAKWPFGPPSERLRYIFCVSKYPAYPEDVAAMPARFSAGGFYGYSDHCHGIGACLLAVGRGAGYVEKHFTLNKASQVIRDHTLSATPEEFGSLTQLGGEIARFVDAAVRDELPAAPRHTRAMVRRRRASVGRI
jgi:sialic acid synthase SpsE